MCSLELVGASFELVHFNTGFPTRHLHLWHVFGLIKVYLMSLSRKLYLPKSLSFGAIKWSFRALASFIKRNSLRSIHSFSSSSPWAMVHLSPSGHVPLRNLQPANTSIRNMCTFVTLLGCRRAELNSPLADFEDSRGEAILPAVLVVLGVEHAVLMLFWGDVLLPLFLTIAVLPTQPAVLASLARKTNVRQEPWHDKRGVQINKY